MFGEGGDAHRAHRPHAPTDESTPAGGDASVESIKSRLETYPNDSSLVTMDMKDGIMQLKKDYDAADAAGADLDQATGLKMNLLYNALSGADAQRYRRSPAGAAGDR